MVQSPVRPSVAVPQDAAELNATTRRQIPSNRFQISGIDHSGIPCHDVANAGRFYEEILGAQLAYRAGFSDEEQQLGRPKHAFYHIGNQLVEIVPAYWDERAYAIPESDEANPHWAFGATPQGLLAFMENLQREGIPFSGPRSHRRASAVSIYFRDIDGNKLEVTTYDPIPAGIAVTPIGGPHGGVPWAKLAHNWKPREG